MDKRLIARLKAAHGYYTEDKNINMQTKILQTQDQGFLIPDEGEKTSKISQRKLKEIVPEYNSALMFELDLKFGGYFVDYTKNGSFLLIGGQKGHVALMKWRNAKLMTEFYTKELIRDVKFMQNELMFAVAQRKAVYIYDSQGIEIHHLKNHIEPQKLEYLNYHFLMVTANNHGFLKYLDISTGLPVAEHRFHFENVNDLKQNPWNAVVSVADARGLVTMWTPNINKPVVKLVAHNGPCTKLAIDMRGLYMATSGADNRLKIYDVRALADPLYEYWTEFPCSGLDISQSGLLSCAELSSLKVWKDWQIAKQKIPYMEQALKSPITDLKFVPFEDFLGVGTQNGFTNACIPGSGLANFDTFEANPFCNSKQRQEQEVKNLLDKLPPDTIVLNPHEIGVVDKAEKSVILAEEKALKEEEERKNRGKSKKKTKKSKEEIEEKKKRNSAVHDKKTRQKIQDSIREKDSERIEMRVKAARDIQFLNEATSEILGLPTKRKKRSE